MTTALLASAGFTSCLLGKHVDFSEAGGFPVTPPAILEESGGGTPLPNSFIKIAIQSTDSDAGNPSFTLPIVARVFQPNSTHRVDARFFVDRPRTCTTPGGTCSSVFVPDPPMQPPDAAPNVWEIRRLLTFPNPVTTAVCHTVDLYVSSQLRPIEDGEAHFTEPVHPYDIAHARWFVYLLPANLPNMDTPNISGCSYLAGNNGGPFPANESVTGGGH